MSAPDEELSRRMQIANEKNAAIIASPVIRESAPEQTPCKHGLNAGEFCRYCANPALARNWDEEHAPASAPSATRTVADATPEEFAAAKALLRTAPASAPSEPSEESRRLLNDVIIGRASGVAYMLSHIASIEQERDFWKSGVEMQRTMTATDQNIIVALRERVRQLEAENEGMRRVLGAVNRWAETEATSEMSVEEAEMLDALAAFPEPAKP